MDVGMDAAQHVREVTTRNSGIDPQSVPAGTAQHELPPHSPAPEELRVIPEEPTAPDPDDTHPTSRHTTAQPVDLVSIKAAM